jgi:hypothetical protein
MLPCCSSVCVYRVIVMMFYCLTFAATALDILHCRVCLHLVTCCTMIILMWVQVIVDAFNQSVTRASFKRIQGLAWLNDEVINMYMQV